MFAIPSSYSLRVNIPSLGETAANIQVAFDLCGAVNVSIQTGREIKVRIPILIPASGARQRRCGRDDEAQASFGCKKIQIHLISVPQGSLPASKNVFGSAPSPHKIKVGNRLNHGPGGTSGKPSSQRRSSITSSTDRLRAAACTYRCSKSGLGRFSRWIFGISATLHKTPE